MDHEANKKSFLEGLRSQSESTKRNVFVISTVVIMIVVVYVWLGYFNGLVAGASPEPVAESGSGGGFWDAMRGGFANIVNGFEGHARWLGRALRNGQQYTVKP